MPWDDELEDYIDDDLMWCGYGWHHPGHYWTDYDGLEWWCEG